MSDDIINHPEHYTAGSIEVIDFIEAWNMNFIEGAIIKYVTRYKHKNGIVDLKKARWFLNRLIETEEKKEREHLRNMWRDLMEDLK